MIKGNERRVVVIKGDKESVYDMACLFMKEEYTADTGEDSIIREAERIINNASTGESRCEDERRVGVFSERILSFITGVITGGGISFGAYFIIRMLFTV